MAKKSAERADFCCNDDCCGNTKRQETEGLTQAVHEVQGKILAMMPQWSAQESLLDDLRDEEARLISERTAIEDDHGKCAQRRQDYKDSSFKGGDALLLR